MADADLFNRVRKIWRHRRRWAARQGLEAFRVYDRDIPEHPYTVDWYAGRILCIHYPSRRRPGGIPEAELRAGLAEVFEAVASEVYLKTKTPRRPGPSQYEKLADTGRRLVVAEQGLRFQVNLSDYVDTGLFLDHRLTRARVRDEAKGRRFLNLFCYTGAFSVYAAAGGAESTTSVDLSNTYLAWARDNLALNELEGPRHQQVRADVLRWITTAPAGAWDLAVLDPPSFSRSKAMRTEFEIQADHPVLLAATLRLLAPGGVLYFSTNYRGFELSPAAAAGCAVEELTPASIPEDFRDRQVHRCFRIVTPR